jgi:hypothetical protein
MSIYNDREARPGLILGLVQLAHYLLVYLCFEAGINRIKGKGEDSVQWLMIRGKDTLVRYIMMLVD